MPTVKIMNEPAGGGDVSSLQILFQECVDLLFHYSSTHPDRDAEVRVTYGSEGPRLGAGGSAALGYDIELTAKKSRFNQHLYQFAHELCHVLAQVDKSLPCNQWFEES